MKTIKTIFGILTVALTISCNSDDGNQEMQNNAEVYVNYSVAGNSKNGTFNIVSDANNSEQNVYGIVVPNDDGNAALVEYLDGNQLLSVGFSVPAAIGTYEITETNPYGYNIGFGFEDISLEASTVSINITAIEFNGVVLEHIKGSFTGVALYTFSENGEDMEEAHLVDGTFEYNSPSY